MNYILSGILITFSIIMFFVMGNLIKRGSHQLVLLILFFAATLIYSFGYALELLSSSLEGAMFWNGVQYLGLPFICGLLLINVLYFTDNRRFLASKYILTLMFVPIFSVFSRYSNSLHNLFYSDYFLSDSSGYPLFILKTGPLMYPLFVYQLVCVVLSLAVLFRYFKTTELAERSLFYYKSISVLVIALPAGASFFTFLRLLPFDLVPLTMLFSLLFLINIFMRKNIPVARNTGLSDLRSNEELLLMVLKAVDNIIILFNISNKTVSLLNDAYEELFGQTLEAVASGAISQILGLVHPDDRDAVERELQTIERGEYSEGRKLEYRMKNKDGKYCWVRASILPILQGAKSVSFVVFSISNITEERKVLDELTKKAEFDATGVYNRSTVFERIEQFLDSREADDCLHALLLFDIDDLKQINDSCGHAAGDRIVEGLANILRFELPGQRILGRIGGDEFIALVKDVVSKDHLYDALSAINKKCARLKTEYSIGTPVSVSIGGVFLKEGGDSIALLYEKADIALYKVKHGSKNSFYFYGD